MLLIAVVLQSKISKLLCQELIESVPSLWTEEQQSTLMNAGVSMTMILDSYQGLLSRESLKLDRKGANGELHQKVAKDVIAQCKGLSTNMLSRLAMGLKRADSGLSTSTLLMLGDLVTPEAGSCCRVIQSLLQSKLQEPVHVVDPTEAIKDLDAAATQMLGFALEKLCFPIALVLFKGQKQSIAARDKSEDGKCKSHFGDFDPGSPSRAHLRRDGGSLP